MDQEDLRKKANEIIDRNTEDFEKSILRAFDCFINGFTLPLTRKELDAYFLEYAKKVLNERGDEVISSYKFFNINQGVKLN
jgi:hypothetical protein